MFFSDKSPSSSSSLRICFLFLIFCKDFLIFAASRVETLLVFVGLSAGSTSNPFLPKGSLLKFPLSEP